MNSLKSTALIVIVLGGNFLVACDPLEDGRPVENGDVVINEVYASGEDWVELYNNKNASVELDGYFVYDNETAKYMIPQGTVIPAKGFIVLFCNDLGTGLNTNFKLTSAGETVYLENNAGTLISRVEFPPLSAGQVYGRFPDGAENLFVSGVATQGLANGASETPAVVSTTRDPLVPPLNNSVLISATVANSQKAASVKLFYRINTTVFLTIGMVFQNGVYTATIPGQPSTGIVEYYIEVTGNNGLKSYEPATAPNKMLHYLLNTDALPTLKINEFLALNTSCCPDNSTGTAEFDDWIEIYNAGTAPVNIAGMHISDNKLNPFKYKISDDEPLRTTIPAGGYLVIWADSQSEQGVLHTNFSLSGDGEDIGLYYKDGRKIDDYTFGPQSENVSWGRSMSGATTWKSFANPTPGAPN
jgi:hypothetical protein